MRHLPTHATARRLRLGGWTGRVLGSAAALALSLQAPASLAFEAATPPPAPDAAALAAAAAAGPASTAAHGARCVGPAFDDTAAFQAAIDTGHTVYAPAMGGHCHVTRPLVMRTPGQIFYGDGRARTKIEVQPGFAGEGVFVARTGEPGPVWRDMSVSFAQPDTDQREKLTRYPPAFFARDTPRFEMEHVGCYVATTCVDMKGNSGGATIADFQMSAFETGIDIDGSLDTVRITDPHWWPFGLSKGQQAIFMDQGTSQTIGIKVGRMDDLKVTGGLFSGGLGMKIYRSAGGAAFAALSSDDFDTGNGLELDDGFVQVSASEFMVGNKASRAILQSGGSLSLSSTLFFVGAPLLQPLISIENGSFTASACHFDTNFFDVSTLQQDGAQSIVVIDGSFFSRTPNRGYAKPTLLFLRGRTLFSGNYMTDKGTGPGTFVTIENDNPFNRFTSNSSPGWPPYSPTRRTGTYFFN